MPEKEWLTTEEVANQLGVQKQRIYNAVSAMRRLNAIRTTLDPNNYTRTLIFAEDVPALRQFLRIDDQTA